MTNLLAIDTSSPICTVVLECEGRLTIRQIEGARNHGRMLLSMVQEVLHDAGIAIDDIGLLAVVSGPGSFTGLRVGVSVVQGLAMALEVRTVLVSSLEWQALSLSRIKKAPAYVVCRKARDSEYYFALYSSDGEGLQQLGEETVGPIDDLAALLADRPNASTLATGDGWLDIDRFPDSIGSRLAGVMPDCLPDAASLCALARRNFSAGQAVRAEKVLPSYLKENLHYRKSG